MYGNIRRCGFIAIFAIVFGLLGCGDSAVVSSQSQANDKVAAVQTMDCPHHNTSDEDGGEECSSDDDDGADHNLPDEN